MPMSFKNSPYFLCHHGIKGQHWGVRRFQNEDGSLTAAGKEHYDVGNQDDETSGTSTKENHTNSKNITNKSMVSGLNKSSKQGSKLDRKTKRDINHRRAKIMANAYGIGIGMVSNYLINRSGMQETKIAKFIKAVNAGTMAYNAVSMYAHASEINKLKRKNS